VNQIPAISFVVLNYNRIDIIEQNLDRLLEISWPNKEIVVVDNCSTDGSRQLIRDKYAHLPGVIFIESPSNGGVCPGRNQGFMRASGDYVVYLDDDSIAPLDICRTTVEVFEANPTVGCISYLIRSMPDGRLLNDLDVRHIANYWGGAHAFRNDIFRHAGYLDKCFFFGGEEFDHSISIRESGYEVVLCKDIVVEHFSATPSNNVFAQRAANWMASMNFVYLKRFPWRYALPLILRQWMSMSLAAVKRGVFSPLFKGPWITLKGLPSILRRRQVMSDQSLAFYLDPHTQPNHCRIPFSKIWAGHHARKARHHRQKKPPFHGSSDSD
jgi:GT2 family glycosyltransferase